MRQQYRFFALVAASSALTLIKLAILAAVLPAEDFALYSAVFSLVGVGASLLSFGKTEGMVKRFTRLAALGRSQELRQSLGTDARIIFRRHAVALLPVVAVTYLLYGSSMALPAGAAVVLALAANGFAIVAALYRAYDRLLALGIASLGRTIAAVIFVVGASMLAGWEAGLAAEAAVSATLAVTLLLHLRYTIRANAARATELVADLSPVSGKSDGLWLFAAFTVALVPISFDRLWLVHFAEEDAARYAFCGIWALAAYSVSSVYVQKLGPELIRMSAKGQSIVDKAARRACLLSTLLAIGTLLSLGSLSVLWPDAYWTKYSLTTEVVIVAALMVSVQVSPIFDWCLIALDGERIAFAGALAFALVCLLLFSMCAVLGLGSNGYMLSMAAGRLAQVALTGTMASKLDRKSGTT